MNSETLLLRQINPSFVQDGRVTSQAFHPTPKDENKLSVYDGDQITPQKAWQHFIGTPNCHSVGVMAVSQGECTEQNVSVVPDGVPFPEHAYLDFSNMSNGDRKRKAKALSAKALQRGWLFNQD